MEDERKRDLEKRMNITYMFTVHVFDHLVRGKISYKNTMNCEISDMDEF